MFSPLCILRIKPTLLTLTLAMACVAAARADIALPGVQGPVEITSPIAQPLNLSEIHSSHLRMIGQIKADYAYLHGITGRGVTVAITDTGLTSTHPKFSSPHKLLPGYNTMTGTQDVTDSQGHGTHVAGLIGAKDRTDLFGVAYDTHLLPIKVFPDQETGSTKYLDRGLRYAIGKASIVNMSLGAATAYDPSALQEAVQAGLLIVAAAGNGANAHPQWPARFAKQSWANNQIIAVGAVDENNRIASFSNRAGDTAPWFLVAPGVGIASTYLSQYAYMSGTSMATPLVSGAAALIKQMWPSLHADQIANILFITATDLGAPGIDPIYGRGLLNIEQALQPVGTVTTKTWNGVAIQALNTSLSPSSATSKLWNLAASGHLRIVGFDRFNRDFHLDLGASILKPRPLSLDQVLSNIDRHAEVTEQVLADGSRWSASYASLQAGSMNTGRLRLMEFSLRSRLASGMEIAFGSGRPGMYFGIDPADFSRDSGQPLALEHPYLALAPSMSYAAIGRNFKDDLKLKFGWLTSGLNQTIASQESMCISPILWGPSPKTTTALLEFSKKFDDAALSLSFSRTSELNAYLGTQTVGALTFGPEIVTNAAQVSSAWFIAPKIILAGQLAYGITLSGPNNNSLIADMSTLRTNAFSVALIAADRLVAGDRLSLTLAQPMRAYQGSMTLDVVANIDGNGAEIRERRIFSMTPDARELKLETSYRAPLRNHASATLAMSFRRHPNNFADVATEKLLAIRYLKQF